MELFPTLRQIAHPRIATKSNEFRIERLNSFVARFTGLNAMSGRLSNSQLLLISKGDAGAIKNYRFGIHLHSAYGLDIDQLLENAAKDRFEFAQRMLKCARSVLNLTRPQYRAGLSRSYYSMYHAARAVIFLVEKGDDYEAHQELPKHLPKDFPDRPHWENEIKTARFERNRADYDPYPKADRAFAKIATSTLNIAETFCQLLSGTSFARAVHYEPA
jgi:uncharacterized protein (UPF0332 family)